MSKITDLLIENEYNQVNRDILIMVIEKNGNKEGSIGCRVFGNKIEWRNDFDLDAEDFYEAIKEAEEKILYELKFEHSEIF